MGAFKLGGVAGFYYGPTNTRTAWPTSGAAANLNVIKHVGDLKLMMDKEKLDATTRDTASGGWKAFVAALIDGGVEFKLNYDPTDTSYQALSANFFANDGRTFQCAILNGDKGTVGTEGLWIDAQVFKFEKGEPVNGLQTMDVAIAPALASGTSALPPSWITVS